MLSILITGSNQGIGFATIRQIIEEIQEDVRIYVSARSEEKSREAIEKLEKDVEKRKHESGGIQIDLIPIEIDVTKIETIKKAVEKIPQLDILVNNAGLYIADDFSNLDKLVENMETLFKVNVIGPITVTTAFIPLLEKSTHTKPSVINVSTGLANFQNMLDKSSPQFTNKEMIYPCSKISLNSYSVWLSKQKPDWRIIAFAPGHTSTALNGFTGKQTVETAAKYLFDIIVDHQGPTGVFIQRNKVQGW